MTRTARVRVRDKKLTWVPCLLVDRVVCHRPLQKKGGNRPMVDPISAPTYNTDGTRGFWGMILMSEL